MDQQFEHLSDAQIENYGDRTGAGPNQSDHSLDEAIEGHLEACDGCRTRVLEFHRARIGLMNERAAQQTQFSPDEAGNPAPTVTEVPGSASLEHGISAAASRAPSASHRSPDCPTEDALRDLAAGLSSADAAARLTQHAAQCDHCGPILRAYTEDFSDDLSAEDQSLLTQLNSASPSWQKKMAAQMAETTSPQMTAFGSTQQGVAQPPSAVLGKKSSAKRFRLPSLKWLLVPATAIATAVIAFFIWNAQRQTPQKVEKLLAQAYTEQRTMEMRFPGSEYAPMRVTRGTEDSRFNRPAALLEAEGIISRNQGKSKNDIRWLQAKARAEILERQPEAAIKTLNRALTIAPQSPELMQELALSHFELGQTSQDPQEFGTAIDLLSRVLSQQPDNSIALFNRALALDQLALYDREIADWKHYLSLQGNDSWSEEARERLKAAEQKVQNKEQSFRLSQDLLSRGSYWHPSVPIETLFDISVSEWFLKALHADTAGRESMQNLEHLAEMLKDQHGDLWLTDFLRTIHDARAAPAIQYLVASVRNNAGGNTGAALENSASAILIFNRLDNNSGLYLAKFEHAYSLGRSGDDSHCAVEVAADLRQLPPSYRWLRIQFQIENAICRGSLGELETASDFISKALRQAHSAGFDVLYLRALGTEASIQTAIGNTKLAWTLNLQGLGHYWAGPSPPERAYQFYDGLSYAADKQHLSYLTLEIGRQAVSAIAETPNKTTEAMARYQLGKAALQVGSTIEARTQFEAAEALFNSEPSSKAAQVYRVDGQLSLARMDLDSRDLTSASRRLFTITPIAKSISNFPLLIELNEELGELDVAQRNFLAAVQHFQKAAAIGDAGLTHLHTDADRNDWDGQVRTVYRQLVQVVLRNSEPEKALDLWEWYKAAPFLAGRHRLARSLGPNLMGLGSTTRVQILKQRFQRETVVSYALLPQTPAAFVWDDRGIHMVSLPVKDADVDLLSKTFIAECSDPSSDLTSLEAHAEKLYAILIKPIAPMLDPSRTLILEPDGALNLLPFQALKDANGSYLNDKFKMVISPAALLSRRAAEHIEPKNWHVLAVGVTSSKAYPLLPSIPEAATEASAVGSLFAHSKVLINEAATSRAILNALTGEELLHIATHTVRTPTGTGLVVHGSPTAPGVINGVQLNSAIVRRCKLAVLSACRTQGSTDRGTEASESLVRAFLRAGVPEVVGSRWMIDSDVASTFMKSFYSNILADMPTAVAVQKAASTIREGKNTQHPFYWGGFSVFGLGSFQDPKGD